MLAMKHRFFRARGMGLWVLLIIILAFAAGRVRLKKLHGDRAGQFSIRINDKYRLLA
jgi:hypothetical protein